MRIYAKICEIYEGEQKAEKPVKSRDSALGDICVMRQI